MASKESLASATIHTIIMAGVSSRCMEYLIKSHRPMYGDARGRSQAAREMAHHHRRVTRDDHWPSRSSLARVVALAVQ